MVRRYDEPVEVRAGGEGGAPGGFRWRGRLFVVREVYGHWQERLPWWREVAAGTARLDTPAVREVWRVEASAGGADGGGVFDLGFDGPAVGPDGGPWLLLRVQD